MNEPLQRPWRVGRKAQRMLLMMSTEQASDADPLIGIMDTPEMAAHVAQLHNEALARERAQSTRND